MKKLLLITTFIFLSFSLTGCYKSNIKVNSNQNKGNIDQNNNGQKEFIFNKNQECLKYKDKIVKRLGEKDTSLGEASLEQIFYSPKVNSCLYVEYTTTNGAWFGKRLFDILDDGFSSHPLEGCSGESNNTCDEFDKKIKEYKNY